MSQSTTNPPPDANRGAQLLAALWIPFVFMTAALSARMFVRVRLKLTGIDDWLMVSSVVTYLVALALLTVDVRLGGARHLIYLSPATITEVLKYNVLQAPFSIFASLTGKLSVTAFLTSRIMGPVMIWHKRFVLLNALIFSILSFLSMLFEFIQCSPSRSLWEKVPGGTCWNPKYATTTSTTQASFGAYFDFMLAFVATHVVWILNIPRKRKAGLSVLLSLGVFAGICAAVKASSFGNLSNRSDTTWANYTSLIWNNMEQALIVICGSVPAIKPLIDHVISGRPLGERSQSLRNVSLEPVWVELDGSKVTTELPGSASHTELAGRANETELEVGAVISRRDGHGMDEWRGQSLGGKGPTGVSQGGSSCGELPAEYQTRAIDRV